MKTNMTAVADAVRRHPQFRVAEACFVSVYTHEQRYGGPEEGGWWYDVYTLDGTLPFSDRPSAEAWLEQAKLEVERLNEENAPARHRAMAALPDIDTAYSHEGYIPLEWSDGGQLWVTIEEQAGQSDNSREPRPHYE